MMTNGVAIHTARGIGRSVTGEAGAEAECGRGTPSSTAEAVNSRSEADAVTTVLNGFGPGLVDDLRRGTGEPTVGQ